MKLADPSSSETLASDAGGIRCPERTIDQSLPAPQRARRATITFIFASHMANAPSYSPYGISLRIALNNSAPLSWLAYLVNISRNIMPKE